MRDLSLDLNLKKKIVFRIACVTTFGIKLKRNEAEIYIIIQKLTCAPLIYGKQKKYFFF